MVIGAATGGDGGTSRQQGAPVAIADDQVKPARQHGQVADHPENLRDDEQEQSPPSQNTWLAVLMMLAGQTIARHMPEQALEDARDKTAALLGASGDEVVFTSGATEANNLAIKQLLGLSYFMTQNYAKAASLLEAVVADPDRRPSELALLSREERRKILVEWNDTHRAFGGPDTVHGMFEARAAQHPDEVGVEMDGSSLTYGQVGAREERTCTRARAPPPAAAASPAGRR